MSLSKRYLKSRPLCKVTFRIPSKACNCAKKITLAGDFNDWETESLPMKQLKSGDFTLTLDLPTEQSYQFRYLYDGQVWENDWEADEYIPSGVGNTENSVVII